MTAKTQLIDVFNHPIKKGDSFMRIEQVMGGARLRFYFFAGFTADGRVMVNEYGSPPRIIKEPSCNLVKLNDGQMHAKNLVAPRLDDVLNKLKAKV